MTALIISFVVESVKSDLPNESFLTTDFSFSTKIFAFAFSLFKRVSLLRNGERIDLLILYRSHNYTKGLQNPEKCG